MHVQPGSEEDDKKTKMEQNPRKTKISVTDKKYEEFFKIHFLT